MGFVPTNKITHQAIKGIVVVPDDANDLANPGAVLYIGTGGDVKVDTIAGDTLEFRNLADGSVLPVQVKRVYATGHTGTAATDIIALY